ncbi:hypothetical protein AVEN_232195-1 [Araneus ventricosus]|uniref:Uncharacterized protein n=1 Tax=Araneus ventricosus TaxID=182803 RepID=A0A4Y2WW93_ARAVE|nr:hypothetical protein AVEN_232195-1 [Araneus ventricosus]
MVWSDGTRLTRDVASFSRVNLPKRFVQDMACFREVTEAENKEQSCTDYSDSVRTHLQSRIDLKLEKMQDYVGRNPIYKCLDVLADMNCYVSKYNDKCGSRAKDTALEIIEKGASLDVQCPEAIRIDMMELVDAWKSISKKGVFIRELILSDI